MNTLAWILQIVLGLAFLGAGAMKATQPKEKLVEKMAWAPARVFGLEAGSLSKGMPADITVIDPELSWIVDDKNFYTKGSHSPFIGRELKGKAVMTLVDGKIVMQDGKING